MPLPKSLQRGHFYKHLKVIAERTGVSISAELYEGIHLALLLHGHLLLRVADSGIPVDASKNSRSGAGPESTLRSSQQDRSLNRSQDSHGAPLHHRRTAPRSGDSKDPGAREVTPVLGQGTQDLGQAFTELIPHLVGLQATHISLTAESTPSDVLGALMRAAGDFTPGGGEKSNSDHHNHSHKFPRRQRGPRDNDPTLASTAPEYMASEPTGDQQPNIIPSLVPHASQASSSSIPHLKGRRRESHPNASTLTTTAAVGDNATAASSSTRSRDLHPASTAAAASRRLSVSGQDLVHNVLFVQNLDQASLSTQAAILESMTNRRGIVSDSEGIVRVQLPDSFVVVATVSSRASGLLPHLRERFLLDIPFDFGIPFVLTSAHPAPLFSRDDISSLRTILDSMFSHPDVTRYMRDLITELRMHPAVDLSPSSRASISLYQASRAMSMLAGTEYVTPTHVRAIARRVLSHHLTLRLDYRDRITEAEVVEAVLSQLHPPV